MSNHEQHEHCMRHEHHGHHGHQSRDAGSGDRNLILLQYMYDHNEHHAAELDELIAALRSAGKNDVADLIEQAKTAYGRGNELLHEAIHHYTEV